MTEERSWEQRRSKGPPLPGAVRGGSGARGGLPLFLEGARDSARGDGEAPAVAALSHAPAMIRRSAVPGGLQPVPPAPDGATHSEVMPGLIVEDAVIDLAPGQVRRSDFLAQLREAVCAAAEEELEGTIWAAVGCPWIDRWFGYYTGQSAEHVERALRKYVPAAVGARSARDYVPLATGRVRSAISAWRTTGEAPAEEMGAPSPGGAEPPPNGGVFSRLTSAFLKKREGGDGASSRRNLSTHLAGGSPLDGGTRSRMERGFGRSFADVQVHTDPDTGALSRRMGARAFTLGEHVGFAAGEYQPGTPIGDALLAHELAHVAQQRGSSAEGMSTGMAEPQDLEDEADHSALAVVQSFWGATAGTLSALTHNAGPALRSGLRLQRCKSDRAKEIERLGGVQYGRMEAERKAEEDRVRKEAEEDAKKKGVPAPVAAPKVELEDTIKRDEAKSGFSTHPAAAWTGLSAADQAKWQSDAKAAWDAVVASTKGTELENVLKGKGYKFLPEEALTKGYYAWRDGSNLAFGMAWVQAAQADPKNGWPNVAHELGGHFVYGKEYSGEVMDVVKGLMPEAERKKVETPEGSRMFYLTYEYPETEIFAAVRERRYSNPVAGPAPAYGGLTPDANVPTRLAQMKQVLAPEVAKATLKHLRTKIDANPEILPRDKQWFVDQVKIVFGYEP